MNFLIRGVLSEQCFIFPAGVHRTPTVDFDPIGTQNEFKSAIYLIGSRFTIALAEADEAKDV